MTKTTSVTHEHKILCDSFAEACDALKDCQAKNPLGFQFASIAQQIDYHSQPYTTGFTGKYEVKLTWEEKQ